MSDSDVIFTKTCVCGRTFTDLGGFTRYEKSCRKGKKRLISTLTKAKEVYQTKKARLSLSRCASADQDVIPSSDSSKDKQVPGDSGEAGGQAIQQVWFH